MGKYPATKKKISEILEKRIKNKKTYQKVIFPENISKKEIIKKIVKKAKKDKDTEGQAPVNTDEKTKTIEAPASK